MTEQNNMDKQTLKIVLITVTAFIVLVIFIALGQQAKTNSYDYTDDGFGVAMANARLAAAKNTLDGTGDFNEKLCGELGELANEYNDKLDYIKCSNPKSIYLDTPDTSDTNILTISDEKYTAKFVTDKENTKLMSYSFLEEQSPGFNSFGGRE